jgi:glycosyltransferase involved in cell wall biosynthesis
MTQKKYPFLISVIITSYNRPHSLGNAIRSVQAQTINNVEIIVVDDHSTTDMAEVRKQFKNTIRFIRLDENKGACAARNTGIMVATGQYVAFLDDDDLWMPEKLEKQLAMLKYCRACLCGYKDNNKLRIHDINSVSINMLSYGNSFCGTSGLICEQELILTELFDESLPNGQDWDIYIRLAKKCTLGYVASALVIYNRNQDGKALTSRARNINIKEINKRLLALNKHRGIMGERLFRRRLASGILTYIGCKNDKLSFLLFSVKQAGIEATLYVIMMKLLRQGRRSY